MKYLVEYFNIQGFIGYHYFTLEEGINSISSKYNGTGKSTLFDCLRLLAARNNHDKEDLFYMINHNALEAFFRMTTSEGETYGFYIEKEKGSFLYTRKLPDEETIQYSEYVFPEMFEKLNLFVKRGNYVNIADRFIDLFSSSNATFNSGLVQELMIHEETEKVYTELLSRMEFSKENMTKKYTEANTLFVQKELLPFYPKLKELYNLLYNEELVFNYETMVDILEEITLVQRASPTIFIDYSYLHFIKVKELVAGFVPTETTVDLSLCLDMVGLTQLRQNLHQLYPVNEEVSPMLISTLRLLSEIKNEISLLEAELSLLCLPPELLTLQKTKEVILELQEEKQSLKLETTNASFLLSLSREIKKVELLLPFIDYELYIETAFALLDLQKLIGDIKMDKEAELCHQKEYEKIQDDLDGLTCPTCKNVIAKEVIL